MTAIPRPAAVLWDMDGTLVDSEPYWQRAEEDLAARHDRRWTAAESERMVGASLTRGAELFLETTGIDLTVGQVVDGFVASVAAQLRHRLPFRPGAAAALLRCRERGWATALVTMSYRPLTNVLLAALPASLEFGAVVTGEDVTHGKPHPEPYVTGARLLGHDVTDCLAIEDSAPGVTSAVAAGAHTVCIPHRNPPAPDGTFSRLPDLDALTDDVIAAIMAGEIVDLVGERR